MRGEVHFARCGEDIDLFMRTDGLQRRPGARGEMAVIDQQRRAALDVDPPRQRLHQRRGGGRGFDDRADRRAALRFGHRRVERARPRNEGQIAVLDPDHPFAPAGFGPNQLPHRQCIEKLVGKQQDGAIGRQAVERIVELRPGQRRSLDRAQGLGSLDQMHLRAQPLAGHRTQRILRQRPPARPELDIERVFRAPRPGPDIRQPQTRHFAEHLADLGRGGEIAGRAKRIARGVIAGVAFAHVTGDGHRPVLGDQPAEAVRQRGRNGFAHAGRVLPAPALPVAGRSSA